MQINKIYAVYFSATFTTRTVVQAVCEPFGKEIHETNLLDNPQKCPVELDKNDLLIVGMPVYAGRIPSIAAESLRHFKGNHTPSILLAVYGNRHYDDALLETANILSAEGGFNIIAAGAFVARHSIFPKVAASRPDESDLRAARQLGEECRRIVESAERATSIPSPQLPGNHPYKTPGAIPLYPTGNRKCAGCLRCVDECPTGAISRENPRLTDAGKCIRCGRCIAICAPHARGYHRLIYKLAQMKFAKANKEPRHNEIWLSPEPLPGS